MDWIEIVRQAIQLLKELKLHGIIKLVLGSKDEGVLAISIDLDFSAEGK